HGCDLLYIYTGDGNQLVYSNAKTTRCALMGRMALDVGLEVIAICANDDVIVHTDGNYLRITPSTREIFSTLSPQHCLPLPEKLDPEK
ncbi:MAG TPA: hypothetical protein VHL11_02035, partial [Phototrophicaceae bacterium]|nr:hypothetical protein [Phototrophicaceae bacterium]